MVLFQQVTPPAATSSASRVARSIQFFLNDVMPHYRGSNPRAMRHERRRLSDRGSSQTHRGPVPSLRCRRRQLRAGTSAARLAEETRVFLTVVRHFHQQRGSPPVGCGRSFARNCRVTRRQALIRFRRCGCERSVACASNRKNKLPKAATARQAACEDQELVSPFFGLGNQETLTSRV